MKKLSKIVAVIIAAAMAAIMCIVPASAENIYSSAKEIESGNTYSCKIEEEKQVNNYKIKVNSNGKVKVNITSYIGVVEFRVFDSDGSEVKCSYEIKSGSKGSYGRIFWDEQTEFYKGTISFEANNGTYYLQFAEATRCSAKSHFGKIAFKVISPGDSSSSSSVSSSSNATIKITMDEGDKISLGALISGKEKDVTWTSSKKSVAKVSSKGRVSAESEGTATLTAKSGGKVIATVVIEVE